MVKNQPVAQVLKRTRPQGPVEESEASVVVWWLGQNTEERRDAACSAVERSGEGRGDGPQGLTTPDKVRKLQITLYRKAKADKDYRFWSLYGEVQRADVLEAAWRRVAANGGTPGVDGQTIEQIRMLTGGIKQWLVEIQQELKTKSYRPQVL